LSQRSTRFPDSPCDGGRDFGCMTERPCPMTDERRLLGRDSLKWSPAETVPRLHEQPIDVHKSGKPFIIRLQGFVTVSLPVQYIKKRPQNLFLCLNGLQVGGVGIFRGNEIDDLLFRDHVGGLSDFPGSVI